MDPFLDNIIWHALSGPQSQYATGTADARRYAAGFSPIMSFADLERPNFDGLLPYCEPDEHLYCSDWRGVAPAGWRIEVEAAMLRMVWGAVEVREAANVREAVPLGPEHVTQIPELTELTRPGPFGPRTIELGEYFGVFENGRLAAMAGERMHAGKLREISGVCTHPDFQGRGLARQLMLKLIRRQMLRGEAPFLHVMSANTGAHRLYERMGFRTYCETVVRVICKEPTTPPPHRPAKV
jgi:ribosomal protein S18 acetylase RimI-like enzyme